MAEEKTETTLDEEAEASSADENQETAETESEDRNTGEESAEDGDGAPSDEPASAAVLEFDPGDDEEEEEPLPELPVDWVWRTWCVQLLSFFGLIGGIVHAMTGTHDLSTILLVLGGTVFWLLLAGINAVHFSKAREFLGIAFSVVNAFLVPLGLFVTTENAEIAFGSGLVYLLLVIVVAPIHVGAATFVSGLIFAVLEKVVLLGEPDLISAMDVTRLVLAYIALGGVAVGWKFVISTLFSLLTRGVHTHVAVTVEKGEMEVEQEMAAVLRDHNALKRAMAVHITQLNELTGTIKRKGR